MRKLIIFIILIFSIISLHVFGEEFEQEVTAYVEVVPTIFLGDNEGDDTEVDDDGMVFATLSNNGADICQINWGDDFEVINPTEVSASHTYFDTGDKLVKYKCKLDGQDDSLFVEVNDTITILMASPNITINSPIDGFFYETREVPINITTSKVVQEIRFSDNGGSFRLLCATNSTLNCTGAFDIRSFEDGHHIFTIMVVDNFRNFFETVEFDVDGASPRIRRIFPRDDEYTNGTFTVEYDESLLNSVILFWRFADEEEFREIKREDCPSGRNQICQINVDFDGIQGREVDFYFEVHDGQRFDRSTTNRVKIDTVNPVMIVFLPINRDYPNNKIIFNITISEEVDLEYIDLLDDRPRFSRLCRDCEEYGHSKSKSRRFGDGDHRLLIKATDKANNQDEKVVEFFIDSDEPRIRDVEPKDGEFVIGTVFSVEYDEDNLEKVQLFWKKINEENYNIEELGGCKSGRREVCSIDLDLSSFSGKQIEFFFNVSDKVNSVTSDLSVINIDNDKPVITLIDPIEGFNYSSRKVDFKVLLNEKVELLEFRDLIGRSSDRFRRLCRDCNSFEDDVPFRDGWHDVTIRATDFVGFMSEVNISFFVDSKDPRITKTFPRRRDYTNGSFIVEWREENMKQISLFYDDKVISRNDCPFDPQERKQICEFNADLSEFNGETIEYWFEIEDIAGNKDESRKTEINVDLTSPEITKLNFTVDGRRVEFDILVSEEVRLEYFDENDDGQRWRTFCRRCNNYNRRKSFDRGEHNLLIKATDFAGNVETTNISFMVA